MSRKENRRNHQVSQINLATAIIGLCAVVIDLLIKLVDWLNR